MHGSFHREFLVRGLSMFPEQYSAAATPFNTARWAIQENSEVEQVRNSSPRLWRRAARIRRGMSSQGHCCQDGPLAAPTELVSVGGAPPKSVAEVVRLPADARILTNSATYRAGVAELPGGGSLVDSCLLEAAVRDSDGAVSRWGPAGAAVILAVMRLGGPQAAHVPPSPPTRAPSRQWRPRLSSPGSQTR